MTRLIDADAMKPAMCKACHICDVFGKCSCEDQDIVDAQPTVDAVPVKWIESQVDKGKWAELVQRWAERKEE